MRLILMLAVLVVVALPARAAEALFAGGCFWCMESEFEGHKGVSDVTSGYAGGKTPNPTYEQVSHGDTGYKETIRVTYDPAKVSYQDLLEIYWSNVDPMDATGQFCDKGDQYKPAIFAQTEEQEQLAEESKAKMEKHFGQTLAVQILPAATFYPAEDYHQDYYKKNSWRYNMYRQGCGRDKRLEQVWGPDAGGHGHP